MVDTRPTNSAWQQRAAASLIACAILALLLARNYLIAEQAIFVIVGALGMVGLLAPALGTRPLFGFIAALCCAALVMLALILLLRQINSAQILASHLNAAALCVGISLVGWARLAAAGPRLRVSEWAITLQAGIAIRDVVDRRAIKDFVNRYRCADGSLVTLEWDSVKNAHGTVYAVARNITERLRGEKALSQAAEDLRSRNRQWRRAMAWAARK